MKKHVEVEGGELAVRNKNGDIAIIPKDKAVEVQAMIDDNCHTCLDKYIATLPSMKDYAESGTFIPSNNETPKDAMMRGLQTKQSVTPIVNLPEVGVTAEKPVTTMMRGLQTKDKPSVLLDTPELPEVTVTAKKQYDYDGCVTGLCHGLAEQNKTGVQSLRTLNNLYGNAWDIGNAAYKTNLDISKDYSQLKVNDVVNLSRDAFKSDKERGIPSSNQHVGYVSKIVDGVPYVRHYIGNVGVKSDGKPYGEYFEEPIHDIKERFKYKPTGAFRLDSNRDITLGENKFKFDRNYKPNAVEKSYSDLHNQKQELQNVLKLDDSEYDELAKIAYGIIGAESNFGRSSRTAYRMVVPDVIQKFIKVAHDVKRGVDVYDENINNLSQGYSSTKESSLHGISDNRDKEELKAIQRKVGANDDGLYGKETKFKIEQWNKNNPNDQIKYQSAEEKIRSGDYKDLEKTNNYLHATFAKLGINADNLESGENSGKAVLATLAWFKKRNPNATTEDLLKMYTGKKDITNYRTSFDSYMKNINQNESDNKQFTPSQQFWGEVSHIANQTNTTIKDVKSHIVSKLRDTLPIPENASALFSDLLGGKEKITERSLAPSTQKQLSEIVRRNVERNKFTLEYADYRTSAGKNDDVGGSQSSNLMKMATDEAYILKTLLGQASIVKIGDNQYEIRDTYDFNDSGRSFGIVDDLKKRGYSPYAMMRALGRNLGSMDGQGSQVQIKVKL